MPARRVIIFANGVLPDPEAARQLIRDGDRILCADAGTHHARSLDIRPDLVIGDMDSLAAGDREWLGREGVTMIQFPHDKDQTDLELAVGHGLKESPESITILGALGARLDHTLGNLALLADDRLAGLQCTIDDGVEQVLLCRGDTRIHGLPGDIVSLVPWGAAVQGVSTLGLKWPLHGETLFPERSRGISNELMAEAADIHIESGLLFIVHRRRPPKPAAPHEV